MSLSPNRPTKIRIRYLINTTHHWEALRATDDRDRVDSVVVVRGGIRCARSLRWRFPDRFEAPHVLEISLEFTDGDRTWARSHEVTLNPFTAAQLRERVIAARLRLHSMDPRPDDDRYTAVVVRPGE